MIFQYFPIILLCVGLSKIRPMMSKKSSHLYISHSNLQHDHGLCPCTSDYKTLNTRFAEANGNLKENEGKILSLENEVYQRTAAYEALRADGLLARQVRGMILRRRKEGKKLWVCRKSLFTERQAIIPL